MNYICTSKFLTYLTLRAGDRDPEYGGSMEKKWGKLVISVKFLLFIACEICTASMLIRVFS